MKGQVRETLVEELIGPSLYVHTEMEKRIKVFELGGDKGTGRRSDVLSELV